MIAVHDGQCGLCRHFGEHHPSDQQVVQIHRRAQVPEDFVDECGHPQHADLHLRVTAISGCDAYEPAPA